jgi:hypothetical protein
MLELDVSNAWCIAKASKIKHLECMLECKAGVIFFFAYDNGFYVDHKHIQGLVSYKMNKWYKYFVCA